jgi:hypothetical protein
VALGLTPTQPGLMSSTAGFCEGRLAPNSIYSVLHRECRRLFPDVMFADLFATAGRWSVPPMIVAVVMVLQRLEGLSDREAVDRFTFDTRWKYAAGGLDFDHPGFVHTVLVDFRARLAKSDRPDRIFDTVLEVARAAGLIGRKRVLDSTPIYDAVATQDTVTLIRSAIRQLLRAADHRLRTELRAVLTSGDAYTELGKPVIDWSDRAEREALVDARARDGHALLTALDGRDLSEPVAQAGVLLATVLGQDLDQDAAGVFRIARRVAKDRVISTVDPEARHGHKTSAKGFDGYKGHVAADPDSEIITATEVSAGNQGDAQSAADLITDLLPEPGQPEPGQPEPGQAEAGQPEPGQPEPGQAEAGQAEAGQAEAGQAEAGQAEAGQAEAGQAEAGQERPAVYGDAAYGAGEFLGQLDDADIEAMVKTQPPTNTGGRFTKDAFGIDLDNDTVTCPNQQVAPIRRNSDGDGTANFGTACAGCPLAAQCTTSKSGRKITVSRHERLLARARAAHTEPDRRADYRATRPKIERKLAHLMRHRHGGRQARMRGRTKIAADFKLLAAAANLARLSVLAIRSTGPGTWVAANR